MNGLFHNENLVFSPAKQLPSLLDFEYVHCGHGIEDVFNFLLFACFNSGFEEQNFSKAKYFLRQYTSQKTVNTSELELGIGYLLHKLAGSFFLEHKLCETKEEFFIDLLERDMRKIDYLYKNMPKFTNLLIGDIVSQTI